MIRRTGLAHYLYEFERGVRRNYPPEPPQPGGTLSKMVENRQPVLLRTLAERKASGFESISGTDPSLSSVYAPIVGSDRVCGQIALDNYEKENAYTDSEVRLLCTVGASMGVALENARLFDETQRLFKESEQRAAELAIINSVQQALAAELNMQGIYDAVGDKIREIFKKADWASASTTRRPDMVHFPYAYEKGKRIDIAPYPLPQAGFGRACPAHPRDAGHQREHGGGDPEIRQCHAARLGVGEIGGLRAADCRRSGARG